MDNAVEDARDWLNGYLKEVVDAIVASPCECSDGEDDGVKLASLVVGKRDTSPQLEEAYEVVFGLCDVVDGEEADGCLLFAKDFVDYDGISVYRQYSLRELVSIFRSFLRGRSPLRKYMEGGLITPSEYDLCLLFVEEGERLQPSKVLSGYKLKKFGEVYGRLEVYL